MSAGMGYNRKRKSLCSNDLQRKINENFSGEVLVLGAWMSYIEYQSKYDIALP